MPFDLLAEFVQHPLDPYTRVRSVVHSPRKIHPAKGEIEALVDPFGEVSSGRAWETWLDGSTFKHI